MSTEWALDRSRIRVAVGCSMSYKEGVKCGCQGENSLTSSWDLCRLQPGCDLSRFPGVLTEQGRAVPAQ